MNRRIQVRDQPTQQIVGARSVGGDRDVVDVADVQQALDVRLVRVCEKGIDEEYHARYLADRHACRDLGIAAERTGEIAVDRQPGRFGDEATGSPGGAQGEAREERAPYPTERLQIILFLIMRDQGQGRHGVVLSVACLDVVARVWPSLARCLHHLPNTSRIDAPIPSTRRATSSAVMISGGETAMPVSLQRTSRPRRRVAACNSPPIPALAA